MGALQPSGRDRIGGRQGLGTGRRGRRQSGSRREVFKAKELFCVLITAMGTQICTWLHFIEKKINFPS